MLVKLDSSLFTWLLWRNGNPIELIGVRHCRTDDLICMRNTLREKAIGFCDGTSVPCRPKPETQAVMYFVNEKHFWFHLTNKEFAIIFKSNV
jgi:hypothetical protein